MVLHILHENFKKSSSMSVHRPVCDSQLKMQHCKQLTTILFWFGLLLAGSARGTALSYLKYLHKGASLQFFPFWGSAWEFSPDRATWMNSQILTTSFKLISQTALLRNTQCLFNKGAAVIHQRSSQAKGENNSSSSGPTLFSQLETFQRGT